jgi:hypothetical protein
MGDVMNDSGQQDSLIESKVERKRAYQVARYAANREKIKVQQRDRYAANREEIKANKADYYTTNREKISIKNSARYAANREKIIARQAACRAVNIEEIRAKKAIRRKTDSQYAVTCRLRVRLANAVRCIGGYKSARTHELIGCTISELMAHLESKFLPGMTWENRSEWHIDHITPCKAFDLTDPEQQKLCFHWTNLQPLWKSDNMSKGAKVST